MNYALHPIDFREVAMYVLVYPLDLRDPLFLAHFPTTFGGYPMNRLIIGQTI